jgi:transposase
MPARYFRSFSKGPKNSFRDAEAIAEAILRPTMKFVATKTVQQLDLQGLQRVRERLVCQRTSVINQIRSFLLERGIAVRQGLRAAHRDAHHPRHDRQAIAPHDPHARGSLHRQAIPMSI